MILRAQEISIKLYKVFSPDVKRVSYQALQNDENVPFSLSSHNRTHIDL